jgi:hypothetical protein
MAGIYITQQKKEELEAKIASNSKPIAHHDGIYVSEVQQARAELLEEILSEAIVLPVEESWDLSVISITPYKQAQLRTLYPNGVIIKPKES